MWVESCTEAMTTQSPHQYAGTQPQNLGMGMHEVWMMYYGETSDEYRVTLNCMLFYEAEKKRKNNAL